MAAYPAPQPVPVAASGFYGNDDYLTEPHNGKDPHYTNSA
jgi:hypothetical protein